MPMAGAAADQETGVASAPVRRADSGTVQPTHGLLVRNSAHGDGFGVPRCRGAEQWPT